MDANKLTADILADELENWYPTINLCVHSANMLRRLQTENEKVNAEWVQAAMALGKAVQEIHELKAENAILRKAQEK